MTSADGYTRCDQGHDHWGRAGAAGLLVRHRDAAGTTRFLLQHRAPGTHHGDTWGIPGGALAWEESAVEGAWREATEELGPLPDDLEVTAAHVDDHGGWAYTTVLVTTPRRFETVAATWETGEGGARWCTRSELEALPLHPGFAHTAPLVLGGVSPDPDRPR